MRTGTGAIFHQIIISGWVTTARDAARYIAQTLKLFVEEKYHWSLETARRRTGDEGCTQDVKYSLIRHYEPVHIAD